MTSASDLRELLDGLSAGLQAVSVERFGELVVEVEPEALHSCALELRELGFDRLGMVTAVDREVRFELVYRLQSRSLTAALFLKTSVAREEPAVSSLCV